MFFIDNHLYASLLCVGWGIAIIFVLLFLLRGQVLRSKLKRIEILEHRLYMAKKSHRKTIDEYSYREKNGHNYPSELVPIKLDEEDMILDFDLWKKKVNYDFKK